VSASSQKAARIDKTSSDRVKSTPLGKEAIFKCVYTGNPPPEVHWTKNKKKLGDNCKFCVQKVENLNGVSVLRVTPYRDTDFGDYKCKARNKLGFDHITVKLLEDKSKNITQCQRDRILAGDPRLRLEFLPRCDPDGSYHVIQCSVHLDKCWCVDQSGHKIADAVEGHKGKHCGKKPNDFSVLSVIVIVIASVLFLLLFDILCHVTKNKGVVNRLIRHRNKRRKYGKLERKDEAAKSTEKQDQKNSAAEP